jgi:hypothetical protein
MEETKSDEVQDDEEPEIDYEIRAPISPTLQAYKDDPGFSTCKRLHGKVPLSLAQRHLGF